MKTIIGIIIVLFIVCIFGAAAYIFYMVSKRGQYPKVSFSRFQNEHIDVTEIELLVNKAIRGVNGWMWGATVFKALYYFINFWSIVFMLLNLVAVAYDINNSKELVLYLVSGSLLFTCLDLWINSKEQSMKFQRQWFNTSDITKEYLVKFAVARTFEELCEIVTDFNKKIYYKNSQIDFF